LRADAAARLIVADEFLVEPDALKVTGDDAERAREQGGSE
jgi:hypothetical protein